MSSAIIKTFYFSLKKNKEETISCFKNEQVIRYIFPYES